MAQTQTYKTEGVILKRWHYKECDKMVRIFTRDYGKITTRAISARKNYSKLVGHIEPFLVGDFFLARSKTIDILAGAVILEPNLSLRQELNKNVVTGYFLEIVDRLTPAAHVDESLYAHVRAILRWFNDHAAHLLVLYAALLQLLALLGYRLDFFTCHRCQRPITEQGNKFNLQLSQVECVDCDNDSDDDATMLITPLDNATIKILRFIVTQPYAEITKLKLKPAEWEQTHQFMNALLRYHLDDQINGDVVLWAVLKDAV